MTGCGLDGRARAIAVAMFHLPEVYDPRMVAEQPRLAVDGASERAGARIVGPRLIPDTHAVTDPFGYGILQWVLSSTSTAVLAVRAVLGVPLVADVAPPPVAHACNQVETRFQWVLLHGPTHNASRLHFC